MKKCKHNSDFRKNKVFFQKAQVQTQIFVYLLALVIVGLVLLYGYNAIKGFRDKQEQVSLIEFENQLENSLITMASRYGSVKKISLPVPGTYQYVCFVRNYKRTTSEIPILGQSNICSPALGTESPESEIIVNDAVQSETANIFLVPNGADNYLMGNIDLLYDDDDSAPSVLGNENCLCIEKTGSEVIIGVSGLGDGVKISKW